VVRVKKKISVVGVLVVAWLGLWLTDTGILVYSADTGVLKTRDCRYLVGVTIAKRLQPIADRCPLVRTVGS
jgi:hypothetical protein